MEKWSGLIIRGFVFAFCLGLTLACGGERKKSAVVASEKIEIRLADYADQAQVFGQFDAIDFNRDDDYRYLTYGWNDFEKSAEGEPYCWTQAESGVVEVPSIIAGPLRISFLASDLDRKRNPAKTLKVLWNGEVIQPTGAERAAVGLTSETKTIVLDLPQEKVRVGLNRMEILSSLWEMQPRSAVSKSVRVAQLRVETPIKQVDPGEHPITREADQWRQAAGSVGTFYFRIPRDARFTSTVGVADATSSELIPGEGQVRVLVRSETGEERELFSRDLSELARDHKAFLDTDLSDFADQNVGLIFSISQKARGESAQPQARPVVIAWGESVIEGRAVSEPPLPDQAKSDRYNVVVVLFDTLRADHTEPYGGSGTKTPAIARLAEQGVTFSNAFSNSGWTLPSVTSLFTSTLPHEHKVQKFNDDLTTELAYLPEVLQQQGYHTTGIFGNARLTKGFGSEGFYRGFDRVHDVFRERYKTSFRKKYPTPASQAEFVWNSYFESSIEEADGDPFFIFLHDFDPHAPYEPLPPYDEMYDFGMGKGFHGEYGSFPSVVLIDSHVMEVSKQHVRYFNSLYKGEISFIDDYLAEILAKLERARLGRNTVIVFLSDHGEEFMEHGKMGHSDSVADTLLRVPLIVSLPGVLPAGMKRDSTFDLVDFAPTLLGLLGVEKPRTMIGRDASSLLWRDPAEGYLPRANFAQTVAVQPDDPTFGSAYRVHDSVRHGEWKLTRVIKNHHRPQRAQYRLVRYTIDTGEEINLWASQPVVGYALKQMLEHEYESDKSYSENGPSLDPDQENISEESRKMIEALGYTGK